MTAPVCRVVEGERVASRHPLATKSGIEALVHMIAADRVWRPVSAAGKAALRLAYTRALAEAVAAGADNWPLPALGDDAHPATVRSLERRGLVADGRLTGDAVNILRWVLDLEDSRHRRPRPVDTAPTVGGRL